MNTFAKMMSQYALSDKDRFPCKNGFDNDKRINTTFYADFSVPELITTNVKKQCAGIQDTFNRAFEGWKDNYKYLTELVLVLNHKLWYWYEVEGETSAKARLYDKLWKKADAYGHDHLKGDEARFFFGVLD